jgi:cytochrome oxidase Cu insertion factor (SCO1/SenC/PrrC family)
MKISPSLAASTLAALALSLLGAGAALAAEADAKAEAAAPAMPCHQPAPEAPEAAATEAPQAEAPARFEVPDVEVIDQDGRPRRFYTDLIQGKTVAVNFVFTTCTTVCPPMGANFAKLRKLLSEGGAEDVALISVSIDPGTDTPRRMKEWGGKFGAGPGWTLVTGDRLVVTQLLQALGVYNGDKIDHSPLVLLGDDRHHSWTRTYGLTPPAKLAEMISGLRAAPARTGSTAPASPSTQGASK